MQRRLGTIAVAIALLAGSACSSDGSDGARPADGDDRATTTVAGDAATTTTEAGADGYERPACQVAVPDEPVAAEPVAGSESDLDVTSFDGTTIRAHWFPVDGATEEDPAPTVLMGPGWSLAGDTSTDGAALFGAASISGLHDAGYHVLTWDPRGFGESGGVASVNDPELEGRDVRTLLDWVGQQPEAQVDAEADPRVGMVGFSYGGGIQLTVAGTDCRVDVIVPGLAWHSLETSLYKADTVKAGWSGVLTSAAAAGQLDPHITSASASGLATGTLSDEDHDWFLARGPGDLVSQIEIPTLLVQGTVDTLFTLDESITNYTDLHDRGVPVAQLWFCSGHGTCRTDPGDPQRFGELTFAWLARYLDDDTTVDLGTPLELVDQDGTSWSGPGWPLEAGEPVTAEGEGTLELLAEGGSGPLAAGEGGADVLSGLVAPITPAKATNAVEVSVDPGTVDTMAVGAPELTLTYSGTAGDVGPERPTRVFAQLVDDETGFVVGNQITPIEVTLDGEEHEATVDLEVIAHHLHDGQTLTLQLVAVTPAYATPRLGGSVDFTAIALAIPTTDALTERKPG